MSKFVILFTTFILSFRAFPLVGEETALMIQLVTTTASQLNELETLVSNTERYTKRMKEYNELVQDEYFKAERVAYLAEELAAKRSVEDLGTLNVAIRRLKYNLGDLKELQKEYGLVASENERTKEEIAKDRKLNKLKKKRAEKQVANSLNSNTVGRSNQLTAQNTALMHDTQVDMRDTQLEMLKKLSQSNRLTAGELEKKRFDEIILIKSYGLGREGNLK